jgi:hypothetical protein
VTRKQTKRSTAYHEAGHAVIARVLTLAAGSVTIKPRLADDSAGHAVVRTPWACLDEWEKRGKVRDNHAVWHAKIMTSMAGAETEAVLLGRIAIGDGFDRHEIGLMVEEGFSCPDSFWEQQEPRLRAMTRMLVRRHRARIERVAKALLAKTTLSAKQVDKLVGRSVNDVKVNAPLLLQRQRQGRTHDRSDTRRVATSPAPQNAHRQHGRRAAQARLPS